MPEHVDTPGVFVDLERLDANIDAMQRAADAAGIDLRPHFKTFKSIATTERLLAAGASGITVATLEEAEVLADHGVTDVFVAYPVWPSPPKVARARDVAERTSLTIGTDSVEAGAAWGTAVGERLGVLVEIDSGEHRTGVPPADCVDIARTVVDAGARFCGVFTHGGHGYRPGRKEQAGCDELAAIGAARSALSEAGLPCAVRSSGSTPTALHTLSEPLTELRAGTYVFQDRQQVALGVTTFDEVALCVVSTVVHVDANRAVLDAGAKALAKDLPSSVAGYGAIAEAPDAVIDALWDHHALVDLGSDAGPMLRRGQQVRIIPNHVCPVVNLAEQLTVVSSGRPIAAWPVDARAKNR